MKNIKNLKILFTNADQLTSSKIIELKQLINQEKPSIVAVSEMKLKRKDDRTIQEYNLDNFTLYHCNLDNNRGRGINVYIHTSIQHCVAVVENESFKESCLLEIKSGRRDTMMFGCFYCSPTTDISSDQNNESLILLIDSICKTKEYSHKCLLGDFNYKNINWRNCSTRKADTSHESKFLECVTKNPLHQHIIELTRCRGADDPSIIDLLLTNEEMQVSNLEYHQPLGASDHSVITFNFNFYSEETPLSTKCCYNNANYKDIRQYKTIPE